MNIFRKTVILFLLPLCLLFSCGTSDYSNEASLIGIFSEIDVKQQTETIVLLLSDNEKVQRETIATIKKHPNNYNPQVLYTLSGLLFQQGRKQEASFWYYVAQLSGMYDANICMDPSAKRAIRDLDRNYGFGIKEYGLQDLDELEKMVNKSIAFFRSNTANYDQRWINLRGKWVTESKYNEQVKSWELSQPKEKWKAIKEDTINTYYEGFMEYLKNQKEESMPEI